MVSALTCHRSKPMKPNSANLYTASSSTNSGLSFMGASHSPSSSSSQSSGFLASASTIRFSVTQSSGLASSGSSIMDVSTQSPGFLSSGSAMILGLSSPQSSFMLPEYNS